MTGSSEIIAVVGATGSAGASIIATLREQRRPYRAIGRNLPALEKLVANDGLGTPVAGDPANPASMRAALRGADAAVYLVGVEYWAFEKHPALTRVTIDAAIAEGVERFLLVGTVYPFGRPRTERVAESHPREPHTFKGRMRKEQEDIVFAAHTAGKIRATELRLPDFYGPNVEKSFLRDVLASAVTGKRGATVGPIDTAHEYVFVPDVGPAVLALLDEPRAYGRDWNFGGPRVTSQREMIAIAESITGRPAKVLAANGAMLRAMAPFDKMMRALVEMHYLQTTPVIMNDDALMALLPQLHKTSYEDGVRAVVESVRAAERGNLAATAAAAG